MSIATSWFIELNWQKFEIISLTLNCYFNHVQRLRYLWSYVIFLASGKLYCNLLHFRLLPYQIMTGPMYVNHVKLRLFGHQLWNRDTPEIENTLRFHKWHPGVLSLYFNSKWSWNSSFSPTFDCSSSTFGTLKFYLRFLWGSKISQK